MAEAQFGEIRIYLTTGLCILINNSNTVSREYITINPGTAAYISFTAENICPESTEMNLDYTEYHDNDITGITVSLADEEENPLSTPYSIPGNTIHTLKIKINVDSSIAKNQQFIIRTFWKSVV